ncbi:MAG: carbohydrate ABC transporter permease [Bacillota bacterium]|jgi:multiple sugar transport system permease protein/putative aldouronate transport system permease protein|nr:carbohydrate ABC transporter permease [Bacillota bacterium]HHT90242.1 carbohydrate ABC transporter permease [Bacillota bacterium]
MATTRQEKGKTGDIVFNLINYTVFTIFTIACIYPFYYLFINTISENSLVQRGLITFIPRGIHLTNYVALAEVNELGTSFLVTVARTVIGTGLMVVVSAFAGYLVTRREMQHRTFWYRFLIITMYFNAGLIPWYLTMSMLGLTNNFLGYIIPTIVAPFNVILVKTYVESIPVELEESAFIDGAGYLKVFRYIIWPLSKPILATIAVFGAVGHWNSFMDSLILMQGAPHLQTVQHRLFNYLNQNTNLEAIMGRSGIVQDMLNTKVIKYTISMVTIIPILMVYPYMQKYFERGIMLGAVKG